MASGEGGTVSYTILFKLRSRLANTGTVTQGRRSRNDAGKHKNETWRPHFTYHRLISRSLCAHHHQPVQGENRMFLSALQCAFRRTLALVLAGTLTAMSWAQTATQPAAALPDGPRPQRLAVTDYSKPNSHFPNPLGPYMARQPAAGGPAQYPADRAVVARWQALSLHE